MQITDFNELTNFLYDEYLKISENFGVQKASDHFIGSVEKTLLKYMKLYNKPLYRSAKRELEIQEAIDTMPHGWWWKLFHSRLWKVVEYRLSLDKQEPVLEPQSPAEPTVTVPAEIIKRFDVSQISDIK